ncbi:MAG TPA: hypothetical protein VGD66_09185 [Allosphingosinicella sp.]|jgi:hypothetical protein
MDRLIPVICDRCRAEGAAGADPFEAFGDLLDFEPVPRRTHRADGWDAEVQRAYIAALSLTGADRSACRAVGRSTFGVTQLLDHEGSAGFAAAREEALAIAADERSRRLAEGLHAVAAEQAGWRPAAPPWSGAAARRGPAGSPGRASSASPNLAEDEEPEVEATKMRLLEVLLTRFADKLEAERRCRLEGRIAEADFCLRQITMLEVALDVTSGDGMAELNAARRDGHDLLHIAETNFSKLLDQVRRRHWEACGDPPRPEHPPRHLLDEHDGFATEPLGSTTVGDGDPRSHEAQRRAFEEQRARDAEAQIEWEAEARRDYEARSTASKTNGP